MRTDLTAAFVGSRQWPYNLVNIVVIPIIHYENIYDMPDNLLGAVQSLAKRLAIAEKAVYKCDGIALRQHNEPAGSQDVWHYHLHVTPRYNGDNFYNGLHTSGFVMPPKERARHADHLREYLGFHHLV